MNNLSFPIFSDGDIVVVNLSPTKGHEERSSNNGRPALVVSIRDFQKISNLIWVIPITSTKHERPLAVELKKDMTTNVTYGKILVSQLRAIDPIARGARKVDECPNDVLKQVHEIINMILHV